MKLFHSLVAAALFAWVPFWSSASHAAKIGVSLERVSTGLSFPVALEVASRDTLLITEKAGAVRVVRAGVLDPNPVARFEPHTNNESGLVGVTALPSFEQSGEFLVLYVPEADLDHIRIARLRLNASGPATVIQDPWLELPSRSTDRHYAGNLRFAPDGALLVSLGDLRKPEWGQDANLPGSILRYTADGSVPTDNPFSTTSPVFAMGFRNPYDLTVARDGRIFATENGDDVNDEVNAVSRGKNYGWPLIQGYCDHFPKHETCGAGAEFAEPIFEFRQVIGATGIALYEETLFSELRGELLVGGYHSKVVHRLEHATDLGYWVEAEPLFDLGHHEAGYFGGGVVDVEVDRDGSVLVLAGGLELGTLYRVTPGSGDGVVPSPRVDPDSGCAFAGTRHTRANGGALSLACLVAALAQHARLRLTRARRRTPRALRAQSD